MKVETSQEKLVRYQKEHEILGTDEKQNIITDEARRTQQAAHRRRKRPHGQRGPLSPGRVRRSRRHRLQRRRRWRTQAPARSLLRSCSKVCAAKQADFKIQIADLSTQFGPSYPKLAQLNNQLKEIDTQIQAEMKKIASKVRGQYTTALQRENMLHDALEKQKQEANKLNESAIEYSLLKRDVDTNRQLYEGLLEKLKEAGVSAGLKSNNFRIVDSARHPTAPIEPNIPRNLMFALVLGLASGIGLAFLLEGLDNTVRTTEQAQTDFRPGLARHDPARTPSLPAKARIPSGW